jgi:NAD(P)-dependent dehydrogenase (short-subunit alcohol dehydrogenase family)
MDLRYRPGHIAMVTGASGGIGEGVTHALANEGVGVIHVVSRKPLPAQRIGNTQIVPHAVDLSSAEDSARLTDVMRDVHVLVNNAGAVPVGGIEDADLAEWQRSFNLKVWGYLRLAQWALAGMVARRSGVIVNIIGISGERPDPRYLAGSIANSGLMAMVEGMGAYSLFDGVRIVGVNPGAVATDRSERMMRARAAAEFGDPERWLEYLKRLPAERRATVEEVADTVVFLASPRSSYTTGAVLRVDGGRPHDTAGIV